MTKGKKNTNRKEWSNNTNKNSKRMIKKSMIIGNNNRYHNPLIGETVCVVLKTDHIPPGSCSSIYQYIMCIYINFEGQRRLTIQDKKNQN